jgi:hypothetical protein
MSNAGRTGRWCCAGSPRAWARPVSSSAASTGTCTCRPAGHPRPDDRHRCHTDQGGCRLITTGPPPKFHGTRDILGHRSTGPLRLLEEDASSWRKARPVCSPATRRAEFSGSLLVEHSHLTARCPRLTRPWWSCRPRCSCEVSVSSEGDPEGCEGSAWVAGLVRRVAVRLAGLHGRVGRPTQTPGVVDALSGFRGARRG